MSKKKDRAGKGAGKAAGTRIPKQIAGLKVPKEMRRKGEALIAQAKSPAGQAMLAQGLTLAAGLATAAAERNQRAHAPAAAENAASAAPSPTPPVDPMKVAEAVGTVANVVLGRLFGGTKGLGSRLNCTRR